MWNIGSVVFGRCGVMEVWNEGGGVRAKGWSDSETRGLLTGIKS